MGPYKAVTACQTANSECWERHKTRWRNKIAHFYPVWCHAGCKNLCLMCVLIATEAPWCQTKTYLWQRPGCSQETHNMSTSTYFFWSLKTDNIEKTSDMTRRSTQVKVNLIEAFVECMSNLPVRPLICSHWSSINGTITDPYLGLFLLLTYGEKVQRDERKAKGGGQRKERSKAAYVPA